MKKIFPLVLGIVLSSGCGLVSQDLLDYDNNYEEEYFDYSEGNTEYFARSERFQDESTLRGEFEGVALANEGAAAVGMVGMVCSVDARTGNIQTDVDASDGDEFVVDALETPDGGAMIVGAIKGDQITLAEFRGWNGWIETEVTVPGGDIAFMALTHEGHVILQNLDGGQCKLTRAGVGSIDLPGSCLGLDANSVTGEVFASTTSGTVSVDLENSVALLGPPADVVAWSGVSNNVALGMVGAPSVEVYSDDQLAWSAEVAGLVSAVFVAEGNLAVATPNTLSLYSPDGVLLDTADTQGEVESMSGSADGQLLAIQSNTRRVHFVRVTD